MGHPRSDGEPAATAAPLTEEWTVSATKNASKRNNAVTPGRFPGPPVSHRVVARVRPSYD